MLQDPVEDLGREAFEFTMDDTLGHQEGLGWIDLEQQVNDDPLLCRLLEEGSVLRGGKSDDEALESLENCPHLKLNCGLIVPLPICTNHGNKVSGFHHLFEALKDRRCRLRELHLSSCIFKRRAEYLACLGQALASNSSLTRLQLDNLLPDMPKIQYSVPLLLPLRQNQHLTHLVLSSLGASLQPVAVTLMLHALAKNSTLVHLDLSQWTFQVATNEDALEALVAWAKETCVRELILQECEINLKDQENLESMSSVSPILLYFKMKKICLENRKLEFLNISSMSINIGQLHLRARDFLGLLHLPSLCHLDISDPPTAYQGDDQLPMDDFSLTDCFKSLSNNCGSKLQVLRMDNCCLRLSKPVETLAKMKPMLKNMTGLTTLSVNNMVCLACESEETGVAKVRDLLENHPPLLASVIKHLPTLERLSMMRYQLSPDQVPRLLRALKRQVVRRNGVLTVQAKHVGWSSTYPVNTDKDALASLIDKLEKSKRVKCTFTEATGVLEVEASKSQGILRRLGNMLATEEEQL